MTEPASHETVSSGNRHVGDPAFHERHYVDPGPYMPPWMLPDAFTKPARTYSDVTVDEVNDPNYTASVVPGGVTPGESEMSWGLGNQNSLSRGPGPNPLEVLKAQQRTNPADPADTAEQHYTDPGWAQP